MKHATVKTMGALALGAAFAATTAGVASAAATPGQVEGVNGAVASTLPAPVVETAQTLPATDGALGTGTDALSATNDVMPLAGQTLSHTTGAASNVDTLTDPVTALLGGVPVQADTGVNAAEQLADSVNLG